jgi:predicted dehydrogenase
MHRRRLPVSRPGFRFSWRSRCPRGHLTASRWWLAVARTTLTNAVGYMARHVDTFRKAKQIVDSGVLGRLVHLQATMYVSQLFRAGQGWRYDPAHSGGGVLITQNSHLIDLLLWLFGPIDRVRGHVKSYYSEKVDDFAHAIFEFGSGLSGYMDASWSVRHHRTLDLSIAVHGHAGTLQVTEDDVRLYLDEAIGEYQSGWTVFRKPDLFEGVTDRCRRPRVHATGRAVPERGRPPAGRSRAMCKARFRSSAW